MHELAICQALIDRLAATARAHGAARVTRAVVRVGALSGVEAQLLERAFAVARAGTLADGARLEIEAAPVAVRCAACGGGGPAAPNRLLCPDCGDWRVRVTEGRELTLARVELADFAETERETA